VGIRPEVLEASYKSIVHTLGDLNHKRNIVLGSAIRSDLIKNENEPIIMRICAVFWKDRLQDYEIDSISQQNGFSMEALFTDWEFLINDQIYTRQEKPDITEKQVDDLIFNGIPIYDSDGNRVVVLAGTLEKPIEFSGFGVIIEDKKPADPESDVTYLEVANEKDKQNNEGVENKLSFKVFETENDYNVAVATIVNQAKQELQLTIEKLDSDLKTAQATIVEKDNLLKEKDALLKENEEKLKSTEATLIVEKEAKEKAEQELQKIAVATRFEARKTTLASKGITYRPEKEEFIKNSADELFNDWLADMEVIANAAAKTFETKAEKLGLTKEIIASVGLTLDDHQENNKNQEKQNDKVKLTAF
jgi:hypothetical protein